MDGLSAVQSRIAAIQGLFATSPRLVSPLASDWASVAAAAGLNGPTASPATSQPTGTATTIADSTATTTESVVVAAARKYLGVPYRWGGTDPATGLDCSGFTQRVYGDLGIRLPRTSSQQATAGRPIASLAAARPGDLLFYDYDKGRSGIDHVGIYLGNGQMIAAPTEGESVKIESASTPTLIRRVLPDGGSAASSLGG